MVEILFYIKRLYFDKNLGNKLKYFHLKKFSKKNDKICQLIFHWWLVNIILSVFKTLDHIKTEEN